MVFSIAVEKPSYLYILNADSAGNFTILYPNPLHPNTEKVYGALQIPDEAMRKKHFEIEFSPPAGEETVKVIATTERLPIDALIVQAHEDALTTIPGQAEAQNSPSRTLAQEILAALSSGRFEWSEDTVVIRSHERGKIQPDSRQSK